MACNPKFFFYIFKDFKKNKNKEEYVTDTVCGPQNLKYLLLELYRKKLLTSSILDNFLPIFCFTFILEFYLIHCLTLRIFYFFISRNFRVISPVIFNFPVIVFFISRNSIQTFLVFVMLSFIVHCSLQICLGLLSFFL